MIITSSDNQKYKYINKLKQKKFRDKENSFIIESKKLVEEAISSADVDFIFLSEENKDYQCDLPKIVLTRELFDKVTGMVTSDGFGAVVKKSAYKEVSARRVLLLDQINDPGNMGTIIRSAEAFGFDDIILMPKTCDIYNEKTLRASMGSIFRLNIVKKNLDQVKKLKENYKMVSADMSGYDINECDIDGNLMLAIGNEANGLSKEIRSLTDTFVKIPMKGQIESLNAAIAASIIMNKLSLWIDKSLAILIQQEGMMRAF